MTETRDWRMPVGATGLLGEFAAAGVIETADVHVAQRLTALTQDDDQRVALAVAMVVRALRGGSVCVDLAAVEAQVDIPGLPWPDADSWVDAVRASPLTGTPPVLRLHDGLLYLDRYWLEEQQVADDVVRMTSAGTSVDAAEIDRLFPSGFDEQRAAAEAALSQGLTVLTGGPGTGKTTTVARLLALIADQARRSSKGRLRIALAAPTGKLSGLTATTLHRLLGGRHGSSSRFRHHRTNRLPHDVVVVDETSMVSLTMMARLLEAVRPDAKLLLVGDPDQSASVDAGAVLADLVDGLGARGGAGVATLHTAYRFGESIGALAAAIRTGDADAAVEVLRIQGDHVEWVDTDDPTESLRTVLLPHAKRLREAALLGDRKDALTTLDEHRLLCAHRRGPYGVAYWNRQAERWLGDATGEPIWSSWYAGRPVLVTANDYGLGVLNGDTGVTLVGEGGLRAVIAGSQAPLEFATSRLADVDTMHAMTIHKSQGSQAREVTVLLPGEDSRLLTRELFYTAVTRAKERVRVIGSESALRAAIGRPVVRASGLRQRMRAAD